MTISVLLINRNTFEQTQYDDVSEIYISNNRWALSRPSAHHYFSTKTYTLFVLGTKEEAEEET